MKTCPKCKIIQNIKNFGLRNKNSHLLRSWCKKCHNKDVASRNKKSYSKQKKLIDKNWRDKNKEKCQEYNKKYYPLHKKEFVLYHKKYKNKNQDKYNAWQANRRAIKLNATPEWLTEEQLNEIQWFYTIAKELQWLSEEPLEVDHIIPLQGKNVCGLHVPWNLQILPQKQNIKKSNKI